MHAAYGEMAKKTQIIEVSSPIEPAREQTNARIQERESEDEDPAVLQLLSESQDAFPASSQKAPANTAVLNASLLNAARRPATQSSPPTNSTRDQDAVSKAAAIMPYQKAQLATSNFRALNGRQDLTAGRGDVHEIPGSPERNKRGSPIKLISEKVNWNPLKVRKTGRRAKVIPASASADMEAVGGAREGGATHEIATSPPPTLPAAREPAQSHRRRSGRQAGQPAEIEVDFAKGPRLRIAKAKRKADTKAIETDRALKLPREDIHTQDDNHTMEVTGSPEEGDALNVPAGKSKSKSPSKTRTTRSRGRVSELESSASNRSGKRSRSGATASNTILAVRPKRRPRRPPKSTPIEKERGNDHANEGGADAAERDLSQEVHDEDEPEAEGAQDIDQESYSGPGQDQSNDISEAETYTGEPEEDATDRMAQAFKYLDSDKRSGKCKTDEGLEIARACQEGQVLISRPDTTIEAVSNATDHLRDLLAQRWSDKPANQLKAIKIDAYGYLFRHLALYLEVLNDWLKGRYKDVEQSLVAMRIITPFMKEILDFVHTISSWKINLPSRFKNDNFTKDPKSKFIAPLRYVYYEYQILLSNLEKKEEQRQSREEQRRKQRQRLEEEARREQENLDRKKKWEHWQGLHVWRMECETDAMLRRRLFIDKDLFTNLLDQADERDANGEKFERVPVFKQRDLPPARRNSASKEEEEWSDHQLSALIEGLQKFTGPHVFYHIFKSYCQPFGVLREFTVPEITAKAASLRFDLLERYRLEGWEIPEWIKRIPVLP